MRPSPSSWNGADCRPGTALLGALLALVLPGTAPLAQELAIGNLQHYTENRGWNEAGLGPTYQIVVNATVAPSGFPTLVFAEQGGERQPLTHFALPSAPDLYSYWRRFDPAFTGSWRIVAERGNAKAAQASTPVLANPQQLPLARNVRVTGKGATPRLSWQLPDLAGFDVERIRVAVRGGTRIQGRFLSVLHVSGDLTPTATSFRIPAGMLSPGERYVFQVMLEDLEGGQIENRSLTFSDPYTVPR
jgi:hypothetical protein